MGKRGSWCCSESPFSLIMKETQKASLISERLAFCVPFFSSGDQLDNVDSKGFGCEAHLVKRDRTIAGFPLADHGTA